MTIQWKVDATDTKIAALASDDEALAPLNDSAGIKAVVKELGRNKAISDLTVSAVGKRDNKTIRVAGKYNGNTFFINLLGVREWTDSDSNAKDLYFTVGDSIKMSSTYVVTDGLPEAVIGENIRVAIASIEKYLKSGKIEKKYVQKQAKKARARRNPDGAKTFALNSIRKGAMATAFKRAASPVAVEAPDMEMRGAANFIFSCRTASGSATKPDIYHVQLLIMVYPLQDGTFEVLRSSLRVDGDIKPLKFDVKFTLLTDVAKRCGEVIREYA